MQHLAACALTCLYWAENTRGRIFQIIILRSLEDLRGLQSLWDRPPVTRLTPISHFLERLLVEHQLTKWLWIHNLRGPLLEWPRGNATFLSLDMYVSGSVPTKPIPQNASIQSKRTVRHPLFYTIPRPLPLPFYRVGLHLEDIHFADYSGLKNLVQDFNMRGFCTENIFCRKLTWDDNTVTPAFIPTCANDASYQHPTYQVKAGPVVRATGCTDDTLTVLIIYHSVNPSFIRTHHDSIVNVAPLDNHDYDLVVTIMRRLQEDAQSRDVFPNCAIRHWSTTYGSDISERNLKGMYSHLFVLYPRR